MSQVNHFTNFTTAGFVFYYCGEYEHQTVATFRNRIKRVGTCQKCQAAEMKEHKGFVQRKELRN